MSLERLAEFAFAKMTETGLPGLSIAAVRGGEVVWQGALGFRDLKRGLPATPATLYGIGSVTKSFTALAVMQLAEAGTLCLDDPVERYVPFGVKPCGEEVLVRHLLSHTSGIPALGYAEAVIRNAIRAGGKGLPLASVNDLLTFMSGAEGWALTPPGQRWFYLNEGYVLLGAIIERCSGLSYQDYIKKNVLVPLGMSRSYFKKEEVEKDPDAAIPYVITRDGDRVASTYPYGSISSDGGLISNAFDLARYISMYLGWGELSGVRLISKESIREMEAPQVTVPWQGPFGEEGYGYGLQVIPDFLGRKLIGHGGSVLVSTAYMGFIPEEGVGIAILANGSGYPLSQLGMYGLALMLGEDPERLPFVERERTLDELTGTYETFRGTLQAVVRRKWDLLSLEISDKYTDLVIPLIPERDDMLRFYALSTGRRLPVEFRLEGDRVELVYERYLLRKTGKVP
ncbi:MAG: Beta-lactamase-like protein [Acetothermia bacterium 64_32]|nr:MAG: Beta-lactamase-like protein [Acetothermia bacterium 64_32]